MKVAFYLAHPSQFYVFRNVIKGLQKKNHETLIYIKTKEILENLLQEEGFEYTNLFPRKKKKGIIGLIISYLRKNIKLLKALKNNKADLIVSAASDITLVAKLLRVPSLIFNDDDAAVIPYSSIIGWPFASMIFAPSSCEMGKWKHKTFFYNAYQKTAYLHPNLFKPDRSVLNKYGLSGKRYFIIRSVSLNAHHDNNIRGLNNELVYKLISKLSNYGEIIISSERSLPDDLNRYYKKIKYTDIHSIIYYSDLLIADSQSMCHEAALVGTPSIRFNDFVGKIGVLDNLENIQEIAFGIKPDNPIQLINKVDSLINSSISREYFRKKANLVHEESIDLSSFIIWLIENYPKSKKILQGNPDYQYNFK